ncbi:TolC family protein [Winogradskyella immobilis]|uniref:TolC family protein n=1 Tax=Winogradskyella immobilis TaxID=2816852 RepID=A0ABS8EII7_9FLAO|nr:TolC family protein [Winogradskyella immobilis]MCC1483024.1 TolC family protein [Winogradskyella immobilis]MCG0015119.1 TolC family protein [Winogradskyella immobilis]
MKKSIIIALLLCGVFAQAQKKWTLKECVEYAIENNISIKQSELDIEVTEIEKLTAIGNFIPTLRAGAGVQENTGLSFNPTTNQAETETFLSANGSINAGYNVFDGLRNIRQVQRAKISNIASQYRLSKMKDDISLFVANAYLQVILNKANLEVLVSQNQVTKEQIKRTQELVDAGVLPKGDLLEIKATDASELQSIVGAENSVQLSLINLAQLLLITDYENFDIEERTYNIVDEGIASKNVDEVINAAKTNRSEIKIAEQNLELSKKDVQIARGANLPSISAFFGYNTRYTDRDELNSFIDQLSLNDGISYGLNLNVPILNGFNTKANIKRSKINVLRSEFQLEQAKLDLESTVYQAYVDTKGSLKSYEAAQLSVESQELAYQYAKDRYDVGLTNAFDFSQSKLRYDNAIINANRAKYDYIFKLKILELYFGIPASELKF